MSCIEPTTPKSDSITVSQSQISTPVVVSATSPVLRSWRLTASGLVEVAPNSRMGAFLDKPLTAKTSDRGEGNGIRYGLSSMQGWRVEMEDAHVVQYIMSDRYPYKEWSFFAVFDGHAGKIAADGAAQNILDTLMNTEQFGKVTTQLTETKGELTEELIQLLKEGITEGFLHLDEMIRKQLDKGHDRSGCTAVCAIVTPTHIIIANLGDSRAVLSRKGSPPFGTLDHKPYLDKERERIVGAGGSVMIQRINGSLAVSRALGDFDYKNTPGLKPDQQLVSVEPDVYVLPRDPVNDAYLLLACDGVYDVMENDKLCEFVDNRLQIVPDLADVCNDVLDACLTKGSRDNMTIILVCFNAAPSIVPEMQDGEEKWKQSVRELVTEIIEEETSKPTWQEYDEMSVECVLRQVNSRSDNLHPVFDHLRRRIVQEVLSEKQIAHDY